MQTTRIFFTVAIAAALVAACNGSIDTKGDADAGRDAAPEAAGEEEAVDDPALDEPAGGDETGPQDGGREEEVVAGDDPYLPGPYAVTATSVAEGTAGAPLPFDIYVPSGLAAPPVVLFVHGFMASKRLYAGMLTHLAGHGFLVVAPQDYDPSGLPIGKPSAWQEADAFAGFLAWLKTAAAGFAGGEPDWTRVGLAGHSRGGKVIWIVLSRDASLARGVAGVDPVDGTGGPLGGEERVVKGSFGFPFPSLVVGTELGPVPKPGSFGQACAPEGDNHVQFFGASAAPAWRALVLGHGHNDMLDREGCGVVCSACTAGPDPDGARLLSAGLLAAFFERALNGVAEAAAWLTDERAAPIPFDADVKL